MVGETLLAVFIKAFKRKESRNDVDIVRSPEPVKAAVSNVTASRAYATTYTNNKGRPIMVILSLIHDVTAQNSFCLAQGNTGGAGMNWSGWYNTPAVGIRMYGTIVLLVDVGKTYEITQNAAGGINTIIRWLEVEL